MPGLDGFSPVLPIRIPGLDENGPTTSVQLRRDGGFSALETAEKKGESHELRRPPQTTGLVFKVFGIYQPENRKNWQRWQEVWLVSSYSLCIFLLGMMALIDQQG